MPRSYKSSIPLIYVGFFKHMIKETVCSLYLGAIVTEKIIPISNEEAGIFTRLKVSFISTNFIDITIY